MPTSPPRRSTPRSPTSTSAACTSRRIRARVRRAAHRSVRRPELIGAVLCCVAIALLAACGGGGDVAPTATPPPPETPRPASTGSDTPAQRDLVDLAQRFRGAHDLPRSVVLPAPSIGERQAFSLLVLDGGDGDAPERRTVQATLRAVSDHAYFFFEDTLDVTDGEAQDAADAFEDEVWPAVTGAFGLPNIPGVDEDPRIAVLQAELGSGVGGYVSGEDAYPAAVVPSSNGRELIYVNANARPPGGNAWAGLVAHELQHLIQLRLDPDEASWVNEGLSQVAARLVSGPGTFRAFLDRPDTQLNNWEESAGGHYDAAELFLTYLLEQTGGSAGALAADPANGIDGVRAFLRQAGASRSIEELAGDWAVANLLDLPEGPYGYRARDVGEPELTAIDGSGEGDVHQFATDYLDLTADALGPAPTFTFQGDATVPVLAAQEGLAPGEAFWWSGRGDSMDARLTRELDLTAVSSATLTFRTWFDSERWFDYGYVAVSHDGGATWDVLPGDETSDEDPIGDAYGPGYTGRSGGGEEAAWVDERIDLSAYAGAKVLLRFELVNDDSVNRPGWAIDDIAVPEIGFLDAAQSDPGGWHREGFRRLSQPLPQRFELRLVTFGAEPLVLPIEPDGDNRAAIDLSGLGSDYDRAVLAVVAVTDGTTERARYRYDVAAQTP